ncbi:MAG TPA: hypothetical protein VJ396_07080 [Acidiferrobacterales bacterium]|nr:hypothetical protein [Acidiferrobacterales bacterium]
MKKQLMLAAFATMLSAPATAGDWTKEDTAWQAAYLTLHVVDWGQTRDISAQPERYYEKNSILGEHPSRKRVDSYFVGAAILHTGIAYALPPKWRRLWQCVAIGSSAGAVANNVNIGLQVNFK